MTYEETLHYLYNQLPVFQQVGSSAYKPGLGNSEALDVFFDHCGQLSHDDGLGHVVVTACVDRFLLVAVVGEGREGNDLDIGVCLPDSPCRGEAVEVRHADVHEDQVILSVCPFL